MFKTKYKILFIIMLSVFFSERSADVFSQNGGSEYSIIFGWNTSGSVDKLSRRASAFGRLKGESGITMSFGSFLGPERIVTHDRGSVFLNEARNASLDYIIPSGSEFMFGVERFKEMAVSADSPEILSANLVDERTREPLVTPYVIRNISGTRICLIAMSDMNTVNDAADENILGVDVISLDEAIGNIYEDVIAEYADIVIVAGQMNKDEIMELASKFSFIDMFVTNNHEAGLSNPDIAAATIQIAGKPVYVGPESGDHLGFLNVTDVDGIETIEFSDITLGEQFPPDEMIRSSLTVITDRLKRLDDEEAFIVKAGSEVATVLKELFGVEAVLLERQSLYYYPMEDSLTVLNVREIIKPDNELISYDLKGSYLKSIMKQSLIQADSDFRLITEGISEDMKVNSLPIQDERDYTVLVSKFLRLGGNNYEQFKFGNHYTFTDIDMLKAAESFLVAKEERIRESMKEKIWEVSLNLSLNSNFDRTDVNSDKSLYGDRIPKPLRNMDDKYSGNFVINSQNNLLRLNKTVRKHIFENFLRFSYKRMGSKTDESDGILYNTQRNQDEVELSNKYTYNLALFPAKPYVMVRTKTFMYSGAGKHPITAILSAGGTRTFKRLKGLNIALGISGTRDYYTLENTFGTSGAITFNRKIPVWLFFSQETTITSETNVYWNPMAKFDMEFKMDSYNNFKVQLWKQIHADLTVKAYSYRNSVHRKVAVGFIYLFTLNYNMNWKF